MADETPWRILTGPLGPWALLPGRGSCFLVGDDLKVFGGVVVPLVVVDELRRRRGPRGVLPRV